jgi:putative transposase
VPGCTLQRLLREMGLIGAVRGRAWTPTTVSHTTAMRRPDLLERSVVAERPDQLCVSAFTLKTDFVLDALEQAIHARCGTTRPGLVHHSDRSTQYLSMRYTDTADAVAALAKRPVVTSPRR